MKEEVHIFFDSWGRLGRSLVLAALAYASLVILLRISGKRTLSKMNVFDFVFVVALGSTLASTILSESVTLADGVGAFASLMALQVVLSRLCVSSHRIDRIVNGEPTLLMHGGRFLEEAMRRERVTKEELLAAIRTEGLATRSAVDSLVLETDGTLSVVWQKPGANNSSLIDVEGHPSFVPDDERENKH